MEEYEIVSKGESSNGFWALIKKEMQGFVVTALCNPVELPEGDTIKVPKAIDDNLNWS